MSSLLFLPAVLVGASMLLFATAVLERLIGLPLPGRRRSTSTSFPSSYPAVA